MPGKAYVAMDCLTAIAITAIICHYDGLIIIPACTAIAGIGGFAIGKAKK